MKIRLPIFLQIKSPCKMYKDSQDLQNPTQSSMEGISELKPMEVLQFSPGTLPPSKGNDQQQGFRLFSHSDHLLLGHPLVCPNPQCKITWNFPEKPWLRLALLIYSLATLSLADFGIMPGGEHLTMLRAPRPRFPALGLVYFLSLEASGVL